METQIENNTNPKRVQLDHLLLDVDFFHKPTVKEFRLEFGYAAACWLIELYCLMSRATEGCISRRLAVGTADDMRLENGNAMIDYCLANGLLHLEDDQLTNSRVIKDQEQCAKKRARWRKAKSKDEESSEDSARNVARNKRDSVNTEDLNTEDLNIDIKKNSQPELIFPNSWGSVTQAAFAEWQAYRKEIKKPLKNRSYQAQINQFANDPRLFCDLVARAIRKGWQGLNEDIPLENDEKHASRNNGPPPKHRQSNAEQTIDAVMEVLREVRNEA